MASDLSLQIQEAITSIIETSLPNNNIDINKTYKTTNQSLQGLNILVVNVSFVFEKLTTNLKFVLPAKTATMIAHAMLMEETPPLDTISDDVADAMKESIAQVCGTLQTVINGLNLEELGTVSFSIGDIEIIDGSNYQVTNTLILLKISSGEDIYDYFIDFEENILPFIEELLKSEELVFEDKQGEIETPSNDVEEENISNDEDYVPEESTTKDEENDTNDTNSNTPPIKEDENIVDETLSSEDEEKLAKANKKNKIIKIIVISLGAIIAIIIIGFSVMLYMGMFDKEEIPLEKGKIEVNSTQPSEESLIIADIKNKQIDFKSNMIDEDRLNKKLQFLTKYEILEEDVLAKFKKSEEERLYKLKMAKLEEFALNNKEESLYKSSDINGTTTSENNDQRKDRFSDEDTSSNLPTTEQKDKVMDDELLMLIKVDPKEYKKYKEIITKNKQDSTQISICKDEKGIVNVYVGPVYLKTVINTILNEAKKIDQNSKKDMGLVSIKRGEFNKMCDF